MLSVHPRASFWVRPPGLCTRELLYGESRTNVLSANPPLMLKYIFFCEYKSTQEIPRGEQRLDIRELRTSPASLHYSGCISIAILDFSQLLFLQPFRSHPPPSGSSAGSDLSWILGWTLSSLLASCPRTSTR